MNLDSYIWYADSLAHCGRISEAFEIYNYINNSGHLPLVRLKNLSHCIIDYVLRISNEENEKGFTPMSLEADSLLCQICSPPDILNCPVTTKCGHTFCKECCDKAVKCPVCNIYFDPVSKCDEKMDSSNIQTITTNTSSTTSTSTTTTTTYTFPTTSLVTSSSTDSTASVLNSNTANKPNLIRSKKPWMPDILVRHIVEKWWSEELNARQMNDLTRQLMADDIDEALKFCNKSLEKCK